MTSGYTQVAEIVSIACTALLVDGYVNYLILLLLMGWPAASQNQTTL